MKDTETKPGAARQSAAHNPAKLTTNDKETITMKDTITKKKGKAEPDKTEQGITLKINEAALRRLKAAAAAWHVTTEEAAADILSQAAECGSKHARAGVRSIPGRYDSTMKAGRNCSLCVEASPLVMEVLTFRAGYTHRTKEQDASELVMEWLEGDAEEHRWRDEYERESKKKGKAHKELAEMAQMELEKHEGAREMHLPDFANVLTCFQGLDPSSCAVKLREIIGNVTCSVCERATYGNEQGRMLTRWTLETMVRETLARYSREINAAIESYALDACTMAIELASLAECAEPLPLAYWEWDCSISPKEGKGWGRALLCKLKRARSGRTAGYRLFP